MGWLKTVAFCINDLAGAQVLATAKRLLTLMVPVVRKQGPQPSQCTSQRTGELPPSPQGSGYAAPGKPPESSLGKLHWLPTAASTSWGAGSRAGNAHVVTDNPGLRQNQPEFCFYITAQSFPCSIYSSMINYTVIYPDQNRWDKREPCTK